MHATASGGYARVHKCGKNARDGKWGIRSRAQNWEKRTRGQWGGIRSRAVCYFCSLAMMSLATFLPDMSMPPKMGPMRGVPETADAAIPQTYRPG